VLQQINNNNNDNDNDNDNDNNANVQFELLCYTSENLRFDNM